MMSLHFVGCPHVLSDRTAHCCTTGRDPEFSGQYYHLPLPAYLLPAAHPSCPVTATHNQGASIFGPPLGKPGLWYHKKWPAITLNAFSDDMSDMLFCLRVNALNPVNSARGETSEMLLSSRCRVDNSVNPARGEISEILLSSRPRFF